MLRDRDIDPWAFTTEQSADDLEALRVGLGAKQLVLWGSSYGTHLAQTMIRRHPDLLENVIICGVEGLHQTYKLPFNADTQFRKLALFAKQQPDIAEQIPDLEALLSFRMVLPASVMQPPMGAVR